jgi:hypothetical protein
MFKSRRMIWAGYLARMGRMKNAYILGFENLKGGGHLEELGVDGSILLEWILEK